MRCGSCHTYIPEGLPEPVTCPQCGRAPAPVPGAAATSPAPTAPTSPPEPHAPAYDSLAARYGPKPETTGSEPMVAATGTATEREPSVLSLGALGSASSPGLVGSASSPGLVGSAGSPGLVGSGGSGASGAPEGPKASPQTASASQTETPARFDGASKSGSAFAPYFTIQTRLIFGPATSSALLRQPTLGSLSFGADGFAIVSNEGRQWEQIHYRDLSAVRRQDDSVLLLVRDVESRLTLFHPWVPDWISEPRRRRAATVTELLARVRSGLTPYEISLYRRRLS